MKQKQDAGTAAKRSAALSAVMGVALLFLAVVLAKGAVTQLGTGHTVSGCISIVGAVLFLAVGLMMLNDLRKRCLDKKADTNEHPCE